MIIKLPVKDVSISQPFGRDTSNDPVYKKFYEIFDYKHCGVDFETPIGTKVYASFAGIVLRNENHRVMGNVVGIRNGNIVALYAHLSNNRIKVGDLIKEGELIGSSGDTGKACVTPHLHFELRDVTKPSLKEMVFDPPFGAEPENFVDTFVYTVNNKNTHKSLKSLSKLFFGTEERWKLIKEKNDLSLDGDDTVKQNSRITVPNFQGEVNKRK